MSITIDGERNTITSDSSVIKLSLNSISVPSGNTLQRPENPLSGMIRFNTDTKRTEGYTGTAWVNIQQ